MQSEKFWKLRDSLNKEVSNDLLKELILENSQKINKGGRDDVNFKFFIQFLNFYLIIVIDIFDRYYDVWSTRAMSGMQKWTTCI